MADTSSIMISMDTDTVPVKKEIAALERQIKKLEDKKLPLEAQMEAFNQKAGNARKQVAELKKELASTPKLTVEQMQESMKSDKYFTMNGENISKEIAKSKKEMQEFSDKADKAGEEVELINSQISILKNQLESLKFTGSPDKSMSEVGVQAKANLEKAAQAADDMGKEIGKAKSNSDELGKSVSKVDNEAGKAASGIKSRMKSAFKSAESSVGSFGKRISNTFKSAFIFSVLYKGLSELKQRLSAMLGTNQQFTSSLNQVKSNLAVAFQPIYQAAMPAINALMQLLVKATAYIAAFVNALFGKSLNSSISAAKEMERSIQAVNSGTKGLSAAEKELTAAIKEKQKQVKALQKENKQLQREYEQQKKAVEAQTDALEKQISSFEKEIDRIQKAEEAANKAAASQREAIQANIDMLQERQASLQKKHDKEAKAIDKQIKGYQNEIKAIKEAQKAAEEAKKANQKFTANFDELSTLGSADEADPYDTEIDKIQEKIDALQEEKDIKADIYENDREALQEQIDLLQESKDAIKDVDFSASIDGYEEKISAIREQIEALHDSLSENPQIEQNELLIEQLQEEIDLLQEKKDAIQEASNTASNFNTSSLEDFGINLENLNEKLEKFVSYTSKISEFIQVAIGLAAIGGVIVGVIYAVQNFSTVWTGLKTVLSSFIHSKLGVFALIVAGISAIVVATGHGEEMINNFKFVLEGLSQFIKGVFTGDMELAKEGLMNVMKGLTNVGIIVIESFVDMVISGLNWLIQKINSIDIEVPEWVPGIGGTRINPNIPTISEWNPEKIPIPALAQGAVLPPNKPFYAMLGDQKNGTNLEAPASLIEDIMRGVLSEQQWNFNVNANGSLGALIRLLKLQFTRENDRETAF